MSVRLVGYAYPWDVLGDPAFPARVKALGIAEVCLAASYHSVRAATPLHPGHLIVDARDAALYRPVRQRVWGQRRLVPASADWVAGDDPFGAAAARLRAARIAVSAWIVLAHSTRSGTACPELAVRNCAGDRYPYALCPSHPEVRDHAATLTAEVLRGVPVTGVSLEGCGQLGVAHQDRHDKTQGVFPPAAQRLLSVCCCPRCLAGWAERGQDPEQVMSRLTTGVRAVLDGAVRADASVPELLGERIAELVLATRRDAADALRGVVLDAVADTAGGLPVTLHAVPDRWATGSSVACVTGSVPGVRTVLVPAWPTTPESVELVARARAMLDESVTVGAYLTVLPPAEPDAVIDHAGALLGSGAAELHLYHLGLAPPSGQRLLAEIVRRCGTEDL